MPIITVDGAGRLGYLKGMSQRLQPGTGPSTLVSVRLSDDVIRAIDEEIGRIREEHPGMMPTRGDVVRTLCIRALEAQKKTKRSK